MMTATRAEITIARPMDRVWSIVADPTGIVNWMPGVESCEVSGDIRIAVLSGRQLTEKIQIDHGKRRLTYQILDRGALPALESHEGSLQVFPTDTGAHVIYTHQVEPGELAERFHAASARALQGLKEYVERAPEEER